MDDGEEVAEALRRAGVPADAGRRRRAEYSSDASLYRVPPLAVAFPRDVDELGAVLEACRALRVPLTVRGGGTSIAGNAIGPGVVADVSRHLTRITALDPEARTAEVEPGVVAADLQRAAAPAGLRFGPDPSTVDRCTIGGMIGNNACGSRALAYGRTADNVLALDVLTGAGERVRAVAGAEASSSDLAGGLRGVVARHEAAIRDELGRFDRQVSGYSLEHLLPERGFDVPKALVGTEGTCGLVLGATVRLTATPPATLLVVLGYPDMASAADAVPALLPHGPTAMEGLDARIVQVVRDRRGSGAVPPLPPGAGWLFVELGGRSPAALEAAATALVADAGALGSAVVADPSQAAALWRIRADGAGFSARSTAGAPAHAGWEDAAVPPDRLGAYLREFEALLVDHGLTAMPYGHFGDGCVHVRIDFPLQRYQGPAQFRRFVTEAAVLVARHGGSMSGEHGDGRARSELLGLMYSPDVLAAFAEVKALCDPSGLLNPGVVVRARPLDADLRLPRARPVAAGLAFAYSEDGGDFGTAVHRCTGVGRCRADPAPSGRVMCPSYAATRDERDTTRGRARVLQELADGGLVDGWRAPELREVLDLCLACKGCASDCPTGVDMATYKAEVLHQAYRRRLRPAAHYALGWLPRWARLAALAPAAVNRALASPALGRVARRLGGIDQRRPLPAFAPRPFSALARAAARAAPPPSDRPPVVVWVDTFTERFTPQVGLAALRVLEAAGFAPRVTRADLCCGLTWISTGQLDAARRRLRRTVDHLAAEVADGALLVGLEPSCTAVLRGDAEELLGAGDPAAGAVARATRTLAEVLAGLGWDPPALAGVRAVAQPHCHHHAVLGWDADRWLLESAGAEVERVGGCCGLAGNFGVERGHHDVSVAIAEHALLPAVRRAGEDDVVLADGFSCRLQLQQLAGRRALHLAELLAARLPGPARSAGLPGRVGPGTGG